ncbi:OLC1v1021431C1 [Oldenlandia corymbosa var. corymbosa]|uniref:OLC1v1021431C1 n=1 Tax=Oldenlandia corymbosa var. corymbosa TaxID=529605 RepID=A0AAV1BVN1_OLDCO|nr:OLC1v1021431C1 [Oldenlandia corymbosa var. corymbosa]
MDAAAATEDSLNATVSSTVVDDQNHGNPVSEMSNHGSNCIEGQHEISEEEIRRILEMIAATGKFWHEWAKLKGMLSFYLNKILSQYPEAKLTSEQQISSLGETFLELVKRLDDALCSFIEGPPFTLQRLCEILLAATSIYPKLSKLALALEKNLSVTSMLTITKDPSPSAFEPHRLATVEAEVENSSTKPDMLQNGNGQPLAGDSDEVMTEVEETRVDEAMTMDMESIEETVEPSDSNTMDNNGDSSKSNSI